MIKSLLKYFCIGWWEERSYSNENKMNGKFGDKNVEKNRNQFALKKCRHEWKFENENWWKNFRAKNEIK